MKTDFTITSQQANLYAIPLAVLIIAFFYLIYVLIWDVSPFLTSLPTIWFNPAVFVPVFIVLALLHEVMHWLAFLVAGRIAASRLKIGFQWKTLTPYAHCDAAMKATAYRFALILPALLLGIIPVLVALIWNIGWLFIYGTVFTVVGGGDFIILWLIRKVSKDQLVLDHPSRCGCQIVTLPDQDRIDE